MNKKRVFILAAALAIIACGAGIYYMLATKAPIAEPLPVAVSSSSAVEYDIPPIVPLPEKPAGSASKKNTETVTQNPDGTTNTEISRPEFEKPAPPPAPPIDETQKTDPTKPPEYNPDEIKPSQPDQPTGGETNDKGEIYVPGFGWLPDPGNGSGTGDIANNAGTGNVIGH